VRKAVLKALKLDLGSVTNVVLEAPYTESYAKVIVTLRPSNELLGIMTEQVQQYNLVKVSEG
jgi:hypothetical protein